MTAAARRAAPRPRARRRLEVLGYWFHELAPDALPLPGHLAGRWRARDRAIVLAHLRRGRTLVRYDAAAPCRFACGVRHVGRREQTDGRFVWPEGLAHYVDVHGVQLPAAFVAHARRCAARPATAAPGVPPLSAGLYDVAPWRRWARAMGACPDLRGWRRPTAEFAAQLARTAAARIGGAVDAEDVLLCHARPRRVLVQRTGGELCIVPLRPRARIRTLADWSRWPVLPLRRPRRAQTARTAAR